MTRESQLTLTNYNTLPDGQRTAAALKSVHLSEADFADGIKEGQPPLVDSAYIFMKRPTDIPPPVDAEDLEDGEEVPEEDVYPKAPDGWRWDDSFYDPRRDRLQLYLQRDPRGRLPI